MVSVKCIHGGVIMPLFSDTYIHSKTVDGLPTLKVQTLLNDGICEHRRSNTHPVPVRTGSRHIMRENRASKVNYAQMLLEEEYYEPQDDVTYKPVLVWKPYPQKSSPLRGDACTQHIQASDTLPGQSTGAGNADASKCNNAVYEEAKQSLTVFKTDLTNMLPPCSRGQKNKVWCMYVCRYIHTSGRGTLLLRKLVWFDPL